ncbi:MAG TPA: DMT family transporter [Beijerinckiaceae bacterium]|nr:DMT family transporter [Beijerinckiaceae bacterium]
MTDSPHPDAPPETTRQRMVAIVLVMGAVLMFTIIDASAKWLNPRIGVLETVWLRYVVAFLWTLPFLNPWSVPGLLHSEKPVLQALRGFLLLASTALNFIALQYLQLAQTVSIAFMAPLMVSLLAGPILGEWAGPRRLAAIIVGFVGVLIMTRPGSGVFHPAAILSLLSMTSYSIILLMTRRLQATDSPETTIFYTSLFGSLVLMPPALMLWSWPTGALEWLAIAMLGFGGALGHWMLIQAQRRTEAPVLAPFLYTQIIWMTLAGYLVFGDVPDRWTLVGGTVVIASGLYLLHRERVRARERAAGRLP